MKAYKFPKTTKTSLVVMKQYEGETIEQKIARIKSNKEPITDGAPLIYTDRKDGVIPELDPRADKFEIMLDAHEKQFEAIAANRKEFEKKLEAENQNTTGEKPKGDGGPESIQATE